MGIFAYIALIVYVVKHTSDIKQQKKLIIEKVVDKDLYDIYMIGVWFYLIPPLLTTIFDFIRKSYDIPPLVDTLYFPIIGTLFLPAVIAGSKIYKKFNRGFDYERRIGNKISLCLWIGYGAIALYIGGGLIIIMSRLF